MEEIYTDLDNYNDVNLVEELKNENKELKFKLEEYSSALHQLQTDFDKISSEYKNLEKNYSSLLKTARAEIERKTETIKNLNFEKDMLVINSLQKGKNILHNRKSNFKDTQQNKNIENPNSCLQDAKKYIRNPTENSNNQSHVKRHDSIDTVSSIPTDCQSTYSESRASKTASDHKLPRDAHVKPRDEKEKTQTKENVQERPSGVKIMDRRKSMHNNPECEPTFSSDEESRRTNSEQHQRRLPLIGDNVRKNDRYYEQKDHVMPESFDYYHPPQSSHKNRSNRCNDFDRQRNYDNYEQYDKSRRYYSPDNHHRYAKELSDNYNQRNYRENRRERRADRSPPPDRYNRAKSRDRRHNFERDSYGRHYYHNGDHQPAKTKSTFEFEEPSTKRQKIEPADNRYSRNVNKNNFNIGKERELHERHTTREPIDFSTCQSPDSINNDSNVAQHHIPVIKHTALTPLQDPRLLSNKYILKSNSEKPFLMTVAGSNIDMTRISNWSWEQDKNPKPNTFNQNVQNLVTHTNTDHSEKSPLLKLGEIQCLDKDYSVGLYYNNTEREDRAKTCADISHPTDSTTTNPTTSKVEVERSLVRKYKIPHLKQLDVLKKTTIPQEQQDIPKKVQASEKDFKVIVEGKHLSEKCPESSYSTTGSAKSKNTKSTSILQKLIDETDLNDSFDSERFPESDQSVNISTVEGDLELSDETSDNTDLIKNDISKNDVKYEKSDNLTKKEVPLSLEKAKDRLDKSDKSDDKVKRSKDSRKSSHSKKDSVKEKTRDASKKRKNKRQSDPEEPNVLKDDFLQTKKSKEKEGEPNMSSQTRNKFTDLFGDSNSLITPDDLGLPAVTLNKYVSIFENTQDAIDLSVEEIKMVKAGKSVEKTEVDTKCIEKVVQDITVAGDSENINSHENYKSDKSSTLAYKNTNPKNDISETRIYENTIPESDASNVVKTVIISTGIQPQCTEDTEVPPVTHLVERDPEFKKGASHAKKAIATSTPYKLKDNSKDILPMEDFTLAIESTKEKLEENRISANTVISLNSNKNQNESDVPDVRIFVRRRKKITKKPV